MTESSPIHNQNQGKLQEKGVVNQGNIGNVYINETPPEKTLQIDWQKVGREMLDDRHRHLTTNPLFHDEEEAKKEREQIYVPLALVERKKNEKRDKEYSPDRGSEIYEPQYEEKQRFQHDAFLEQVLQEGRGKTRGTRIALIGEPGAGKTTLLQKIADWVEEQKFGLPLWVSLADLATGGSLQDFDSYL